VSDFFFFFWVQLLNVKGIVLEFVTNADRPNEIALHLVISLGHNTDLLQFVRENKRVQMAPAL
jgi:hypothetical protein